MLDGENTDVTITPRMRDALSGSRRWSRVISIVGFLMSGIMLFVGLPTVVTIGTDWKGLVFLVIVLAFAAVYFVPSLHLIRYSSNIGRYLEGGGIEVLEAAETAHFRCFRFLGVALIVLVVIDPILMLTLFLSGALQW